MSDWDIYKLDQAAIADLATASGESTPAAPAAA